MAFRVRQSGGFWNGVDGVIVGWAWTNKGPGSNGAETEWVYGVPSILVDGKKQPETQHLFLGGLEEWEISADGSEVRHREGNNDPTATCGIFLGSLAAAADAAGVDARLPDTEAGEPLNVSGILGLRVRLDQQKDEKATEKLGRRKSKRGKGEYDRTNTIVSKVYGRAAQQTTVAAKGAAKTPAARKGASTDFNLDDAATSIVVGLLAAAKDRTLTKAKIRVPVIQETASNKTYAPYRAELQTRIFDDAFLSSIEGVTFDKASQTLSLA